MSKTVEEFITEHTQPDSLLFHNGDIVTLTGRYVVPAIKNTPHHPVSPTVMLEITNTDPDVKITRWIKLTELGVVQNVAK